MAKAKGSKSPARAPRGKDANPRKYKKKTSPLIIDKVIDNADAFVAAWLPGTEGRGVTDVLFGDYNFKGKLSFSWPRSMDQIPINVGDRNYDPLFKYGYGLQYSPRNIRRS